MFEFVFNINVQVNPIDLAVLTLVLKCIHLYLKQKTNKKKKQR